VRRSPASTFGILVLFCLVLLGAGCSDNPSSVNAGTSATGGAGATGGGSTSGASTGSSGGAGSSSTGSSGGGGGNAGGSTGSGTGGTTADDAGNGDVDGSLSTDGGFGVPPGMKQIFDGMSLTGWDGNPAIWSVNVVDAAIHGKTSNGGQLINTKDSYVDFRLLVTARMLIVTTNHMGICFWGTPATPGRWGYNGCLDLMPPWGGLWDYQTNRSILAPPGDQSIQNQWMRIELLALSSGQVLAAINGVKTTDKTIEGRARMSPIGLQAHAGASDEEYKDIWIEINPPVHTLLTVKP